MSEAEFYRRISEDDDMHCPMCGGSDFEEINVVGKYSLKWFPANLPFTKLLFATSKKMRHYRCKNCDNVQSFAPD